MADPVRIAMSTISAKAETLFSAMRSAAQAKRDEEAAERALQEAIAAAAGVRLETLDFSIVSCSARTPFGHVYHPTSAPAGIGRRHCVLCGLDDFDF